MNTETTHSETGEGKHSLADFTINRLHDALEIANKSADDQMFQKREAENEVARLRELLNKVEQSANHWEAEALRCKNSDYWHDLAVKAEAALVPAPEESVSYPTCSYCGERVFHNVPRLGDAGGFIHEGNKECPARKGCEHKHCEQIGNGTYCKACGEAVQSEVKPEWREFTHTKELVQRGDESSTFEIERWEDVSGYWQGKPANIFNRRFRTRRPLPMMISVPCKICGKDSGSSYLSTNPPEMRSDDATCPDCVKIYRGFPEPSDEMPLERELAFLESKIHHDGGLITSMVPAGPEIANCLRYLRDQIEILNRRVGGVR